MSFLAKAKYPLSAVVLLGAVFYALRIHEIVLLLLPIFRVIQPIEDFPYACERVEHSLLAGCEDIWIDYEDRKLYAACASIASRTGWSPGGDLWNVSARDRADHISVLDIDDPGSDGLYGLHQLKIGSEFTDDLDVHGIDAKRIGDKLRFWLINHRPPADPKTGKPLDALKVGANSTVEIFDLELGSETLQHVKTIFSDAIVTPNDLAVDADGIGFAVTNDHNSKVQGLSRSLEIFTGGGSVAYCRSDSSECRIATREGCNLANGIVNLGQGLFAVSQTGRGVVATYEVDEKSAILVNEVEVQVPLDNLSPDENGDVFLAAFPDAIALFKAAKEPYGVPAPATAYMIPRQALQAREKETDEGFPPIKILEDRDGKHLPTTTVVAHDAKTKRLFLAGVLSPFITICEKNS
ncbi:calcium-dependent phosphotriesterase [Penicillium malachiteum]|nr:calcium-dependent phosphotriesterase [Penicillium malachiteum]